MLSHSNISTIVQWPKGINSRILLQEFAHLRNTYRGSRLSAMGYLAVSTGNPTDELVQTYREE